VLALDHIGAIVPVGAQDMTVEPGLDEIHGTLLDVNVAAFELFLVNEHQTHQLVVLCFMLGVFRKVVIPHELLFVGEMGSRIVHELLEDRR
jgi:hypothetical protein